MQPDEAPTAGPERSGPLADVSLTEVSLAEEGELTVYEGDADTKAFALGPVLLYRGRYQGAIDLRSTAGARDVMLNVPLFARRGGHVRTEIGSGATRDVFIELGRALLTDCSQPLRWQFGDAVTLNLCFAAQDASEELTAERVRAALHALMGRFQPANVIGPMIHHLWGCFAASGQPPGPVARLQAEQVTTFIMAEMARLAGRAQVPPPVRLAPWRLRRAMDCMLADLANPPSLNEVAAAAGLSPFHFVRTFRADTGLPPAAWLRHQRIEAAKERLACTDDGIAEIALALGFCSQAHFTTAFRSITGKTPASWRRDAKF